MRKYSGRFFGRLFSNENFSLVARRRGKSMIWPDRSLIALLNDTKQVRKHLLRISVVAKNSAIFRQKCL